MPVLFGCAQSELECRDDLGCVLIRPGEPVRIGLMLSLSGEATFLGEDSRGGVELAVDERAGRLLEHPVELIAIDEGCSLAQGELAAQSITAEANLVGIIGPNCSDVAPVVLPAIEEAGLVMISPSATAAELAAAGPGVYFRTASSNLLQARITAEYAYSVLNARRAAIIYDESDYSRGLQRQFSERFQELGGLVVLQSPLLGTGQSAVTERLMAIAAGSPDVLYLPLFEPEAASIASRLGEIEGLGSTILLGADSLLVPTFVASGEATSGMLLSGPAVVGSDYEAFLNRWLARYGTTPPAPFHAHAYDAAGILLQAIESTAQVGNNGALLIGRRALRQAVAATAEFEGLTGTLTCSAAGECASGEALAIFQITDRTIAGEMWPPPIVWMP